MGQALSKAWLYRMAANQAFNYLRDTRRRPEQPLIDPDGSFIEGQDSPDCPDWIIDTSAAEPGLALEHFEKNQVLNQLIASCPKKNARFFDLVAQMEMSIRHAAQVLGIPEGTVKSRLHYARFPAEPGMAGLRRRHRRINMALQPQTPWHATHMKNS